MGRWRAVLLGVAALAVVGGAVAWWQWPTRNGVIVKRSELQRLPEGHLFYPGAVVLASGGHDYERGIWGSNPAITGYLLGVNATPKEVLAFYDRELLARGWAISSADTVIGTNESAGGAWRRGRMYIQIAILYPNDPRNPAIINPYTAPYRIDLIADRPPR